MCLCGWHDCGLGMGAPVWAEAGCEMSGNVCWAGLSMCMHYVSRRDLLAESPASPWALPTSHGGRSQGPS